MISIQKGAAPPALVRRGDKHALELCAAYDAGRAIAIIEGIYQSAKPHLEICHHGKCCYCETLIDDHKPYAYSEVEHWRPKSIYYWLAYSWENMFLSCTFCNKEKGNQFPLRDQSTRATHHGMSIDEETPEILKPDADRDPSQHFKWRGDTPEGITCEGRRTIEVLNLDSPKHQRKRHLVEFQLKHAAYMSFMSSAYPSKQQDAEAARKLLEEAMRPERPYSAMIAAYLAANPLPDPAKANKSMGQLKEESGLF